MVCCWFLHRTVTSSSCAVSWAHLRSGTRCTCPLVNVIMLTWGKVLHTCAYYYCYHYYYYYRLAKYFERSNTDHLSVFVCKWVSALINIMYLFLWIFSNKEMSIRWVLWLQKFFFFFKSIEMFLQYSICSTVVVYMIFGVIYWSPM